MVVKSQKFRGPNLADNQGLLNNFICNDADNLKFIPQSVGITDGIAENTIRVSETMSPLWQKVSVGYKKTGTYGDHTGLIQLYGIDNLGLKTLVAEQELNMTESGAQNYAVFDLLKSACTNSIDQKDEDALEGYLKLTTSLLMDKYDDVRLLSPWYDSAWLYRKGIPYQNTGHNMHKQSIFNGSFNVLPSKGYAADFWYFIIDVAYDAHMQADFDDIRFTGPDGVTLLNHWLINKTDSTTAKFMVLVPWYFGYESAERNNRNLNNWGKGVYNTNYYSNETPKFFWMYYGNASVTSASSETLGGNTFFSDNFDDSDYSSWTRIATNANSTISESGTQLTLATTVGSATQQSIFKALDSRISLQNFDVIWKIDALPATGDAAVFVSSDTNLNGSVAGSVPNNCFGLWINATDVFAAQVVNGSTTSFSTGTMSYNHDSRVPLYIRLHIQRDPATANNQLTWSISRDGVKWDDVISLIKGTDIDSTLFESIAYVGMRRSANNAAGNIVFDWIKAVPTLFEKRRDLGYEDGFQFSDFNYRWGGDNYVTGQKVYNRNTTTKTLDFGLNGASAIYWAGIHTAPGIYMSGMSSVGNCDWFRVFEAKLTAHNRTSNGATKPMLSLRIVINSHYDFYHQKYQDAQYDEEMKLQVTYNGLDYNNGEQFWQKEPISEGPIWMRIVQDCYRREYWSEYSRNGWDWIPLAKENQQNLIPADKIALLFVNSGSGNGTCSFDYVRYYNGAVINDYGRTLTPEQNYVNFSLIAPSTITNEMGFYDDFEDGIKVYNEILLRSANSLNIARTGSYAGTTSGFNNNSATNTIDTSTVLNSWTNRSIKTVTSNAIAGEGWYTDLIQVQQNTQYTAGIWAKGSGTVALLFGEKSVAGADISTTTGTSVTLNGNWQYLTVTHTVGSTGTQCRLALYTTTKSSVTFYAAELALVKGAEIPSWYTAATGAAGYMDYTGHLHNLASRTYPMRNYEYHTNAGGNGVRAAPMYDSRTATPEILVDNQSTFETGVGGVTGVNITVSQSNTVAHSGTYSCKMDSSSNVESYGALGGDFSVGTHRLSMVPGNFYTLTGWLYVSTAHGVDISAGRSLRPILFYADSGGTTREIQGPDIITDTSHLDTWRYFEFPFYLPPGATTSAIRLYKYGNSGAGKPIYWDDLSLKRGLLPINGTYSMLSMGNGSDEVGNQLFYKDNLVSKHVRLKFKQIHSNPESGASEGFHRLYSTRVANEKDTFLAVDISGASPSSIRIVKYVIKTGTVLSTVAYFKTNGGFPHGGAASTQQGVGHIIDIFDDGYSITVYFNGTSKIAEYGYKAAGATETQPGSYSGFGSNYSAIGMYDDIVVEPWDGTTTEMTSMIAASATAGITGTYDYTGTREAATKNTTYTWITPTNFVRGTPLQIATKSRGSSLYEYSKVIYGKNGGWYILGPNGLDKYIGMTTRINFSGTSNNALEINNITYDYDI